MSSSEFMCIFIGPGQERALRIIYRDYESSYEDLTSAADAPTMLTRRRCVILYYT